MHAARERERERDESLAEEKLCHGGDRELRELKTWMKNLLT